MMESSIIANFCRDGVGVAGWSEAVYGERRDGTADGVGVADMGCAIVDQIANCEVWQGCIFL